MKRNPSTGIIFAFGAAVALAASFIFSKSILNQISIVHFGAIWFTLGVVWNGIWFLTRKEYRKLSGSFWRKTAVALVIALFQVSGKSITKFGRIGGGADNDHASRLKKWQKRFI